MTTLKEHIDVLQRLAREGVPAREFGLFYYHLFNTHLAGDKGDHLADTTGDKITIEEFFQKLETPDPPEAPRNWAHRAIYTFRAPKREARVIQGLFDPEKKAKA